MQSKSLDWSALEAARDDLQLQYSESRSTYVTFHIAARRVVGLLYAVADS